MQTCTKIVHNTLLQRLYSGAGPYRMRVCEMYAYSTWNGYSLGYSARNGYSRARTDLGVGGTWQAHVFERVVWERWMWERWVYWEAFLSHPLIWYFVSRENMISSLNFFLYFVCEYILSDFSLSFRLWKCGRTCIWDEGWKLRGGICPSRQCQLQCKICCQRCKFLHFH